MTSVVLPRDLASNLFACKSRTPLCNQDGMVIGFFEPAISTDKELYQWLAKEVTTKELDDAARDKGNATTSEVLARLHVLAKTTTPSKDVAAPE